MCENGQDYAGLLDELERLNGENEQLKARLAEFESFIERNCYDAPGQTARRAMDFLARTPAQSLASIKAQTLRGAAYKIEDMKTTLRASAWMQDEADRIEQEAKE